MLLLLLYYRVLTPYALYKLYILYIIYSYYSIP